MKNVLIILSILSISLTIYSCDSDNDPDVPFIEPFSVKIGEVNTTPTIWQKVGFFFRNNVPETIKSVQWEFGDGFSSSERVAEHSYDKEGTYKVIVKVTSEDGSIAKDSIMVSVIGRSLSSALKNFDWRRTWICAHRCNTGDTSIPENSILALKKCIESNSVDMVEIDPRMTRDGVIVLMHDATVDRTTNGTGRVSDLTYAQIRSLRLKLADGTVTQDTVPTMREFLLEAKGKMWIDLDYYDKVPSWELYSLVKDCDMLDQVMFYTSSNSEIINSVLSYSPPGIVFTHTSRESHVSEYKEKGIYVTQISAARLLDANLGHFAMQNSLAVLSNTLVQNGITIDSDMRYNNDYSGVDKFLEKGVNIIQTDQALLLAEYLKTINKR